ncbi:hypothetical protein [Desulfosporosinus sp. FKA]|uniref:hypothetical protein n=1 Tax=Desulfosporosinus sp. FKA TaxID=1969834 RepID=UPI000B49E40B|nr:hypothetical protein [Desulfosporosinus sp. FKA]
MVRRILLIEPNYKNKYPPMGLMKIATYHKMLGDEVRFFKGEFKEFILEQIHEELLKKLTANDDSVDWREHRSEIDQYLKKGLSAKYSELVALSESQLVSENLKYYRRYYNKKEYLDDPKWDRVYISSLFTFYWEKTVNTINLFKVLCKDINEVKVGGVAASLLPNDIERETGIRPHIGLLDNGGEYDDNTIIIDHLPLDYSILNEIDYTYAENEGYYAYMTRGCVNRCPFCAVPQLEPQYNCFISIKEQIRYVNDTFGEKRNLLLLDNNVLASERFDDIIDEIIECGFYAGATYVEPNKYLVLVHDLRRLAKNYHGHIKQIVGLYKWLYKKVNGESKSKMYSILYEHKLLSVDTATKEAILATDEFFALLFEKYHNNKPKARYVDFNQGVDARLITPEKMRRLAEIPIYPLRIAFDSWKLRNVYEAAVRLAADNGIRNMSNYLLYNYDEKPVDLYRRMKLNVELCEELNVNIYSFPMKYHPIQDPVYFRNRTFVGEYWNRKFIRSIQAILNSTKGKIGRGKSFFEKAFGSNEDEYEKLLYMPEVMIVYRFYYEGEGLTDVWWNAFSSLTPENLEIIKPIIHANDFSNIHSLTVDKDVLRVLEYYTITRDDAEKAIKVIKDVDN